MPKKISEADFLQRVLMLETVEFVGVARILGIQLIIEDENKEKNPRSFEVVLKDMLSKYATLSRRQRKNLMKIICAATKEDSND